MNVLSLFDGISCGMVALERAGIKVDKYYASEIDPYALKISKKNYPNIIQLGDINNWKSWDIYWSAIDLVIGGSPCQGFSRAGRGLNFEDPRSALFFTFVDILNKVKENNNDVLFLLENVKMRKEWVDVISSYVGVEPIEINSALVSAQNRQRLYWTNIEGVTQPEDKQIYLKDILVTQNTGRIPEYGNEDKSRPLTCHYANNFGGWFDRVTDPNPNKQQVDVLASAVNTCNGGKSYCIRAQYTHSSVANFVTNGGFEATGVAERVDINNKPLCVNSKSGNRAGTATQPSKADRIYDINAKNPALTDGFRTNIAEQVCDIYFAEQKTGKNVFEVKDKKTMIYGKEYKLKLEDGLWSFRKLTPLECERLQTLPDDYTKCDKVSNTQRYKCIGNGWTVDVIAHIFSFIKQEHDIIAELKAKLEDRKQFCQSQIDSLNNIIDELLEENRGLRDDVHYWKQRFNDHKKFDTQVNRDCLDKIEELENILKKCLDYELKYKVGQKLYIIDGYDGSVIDFEIEKILIEEDGIKIKSVEWEEWFKEDEFFATREDAIRKAKEMLKDE